ncbi:hypothetical protein LCGC14_0399120 [marine sediment metagenome]|uniref:Uncharacterized protein n=1 Tax=marine sediment metagenome TaxID=412755 RepID=A0A0F9VJ89_9ZZZZ|nr:hypothetical protein [Candidatus Aminicenantes bacterium]
MAKISRVRRLRQIVRDDELYLKKYGSGLSKMGRLQCRYWYYLALIKLQIGYDYDIESGKWSRKNGL